MEKDNKVENIIIRAEFLIEDLKRSICVDDKFHPLIRKAWQKDIRNLIKNGEKDNGDMIYDVKDAEDLKECIDMGLDAEDIAYLVNQHRQNNDNTQFFTYCNTSQMYGLHILSRGDVAKAISSHIENIAYNVLKYPYMEVYGELYREFVVSMLDQQL